MIRKLLFATNNRHKLEEIRSVAGSDIEILSLNDIGFKAEIPEDFETLPENALQKARFIHDRTGMDCFADDTGLEIDALEGKPGVKSARYAGEQCNAEDNMMKVLSEMGDAKNRSARFKTVIAMIMDGKEYFFEGIVEGEIINQKHGESGFGYDPIFKPKGYSQTFAEMSAEDKNKISHRARAVQRLIEFLKDEEKSV
ncbi:MAG: non-canonical purine NTP diphosphatase [Bacteroidales bacterium]|nr:non-canonical purine NTP diphosphatase [Bacteroidales bacterium]